MAKKEKDKSKSWSHIAKNNIFMLKIAFHVAPEIVFVPLISEMIGAFINFLAYTYILRYVINGYQQGKTITELVIPLLVIYCALFIFRISVDMYYTLRSPIINLKMKEYVRKLIFKKNESVELACYEDKEFYDNYVKASNDIENRISSVITSVSNIAWMFISMVQNSILVIIIDPWLLIFSVIPLITTFTLGKKRNSIQHEYDMKRQEEERQRDYTRRTFYLNDFAKEMRLTNIYRVMFERFDKSVKNIISYIRKYGFKLAVIDYAISQFQDVVSSMGAMLYAIYRTLVSGTMMYGDCIAIINSIEVLSYVLPDTASTFVGFHRNSLYIDTIREYLEYEPKIKGGDIPAPKTGKLELKNVSFRYDGQTSDVLHNINITVNSGEKIALVGHNGAGKSTLVKLMLRLYDPTGGEIFYADRDIREYTLEGESGYRERFGSVFQDFRLFSMTVTNNVLLRKKRDGDDELVRQALRDSGAYDKIMSFEKGVDTVLTREFDDNGEVLSGGEGQKIAISRAFVKDSGIVILDEPSSALDPIAEYKMYENMMRACENRSIVFISHRLSSAVLADHIYLIENGKVIEEGSHHELMAAGGKYAEMFMLQAQNYIDNESEVRV